MNNHSLKAVASPKVLNCSLDFGWRVQVASIRYCAGCSYHEPVFAESFAFYVSCRVHVRVDDKTTIVATIQAPVDAIRLSSLPASGTRLRRVFFGHPVHVDAYQGHLVLDHRDELVEWHLHEVLVVPVADVDAILPTRVLTDEDGSNVVGNAVVDDLAGCLVHVVVNLVVANTGEVLHLIR